MTMKACSAGEQDKTSVPVRFVMLQMLEQRETEIHNMIARRAYELFEHGGRVPGHEMDDWVQAESELVYPCCRTLKESAEAISLHIDLPGSLTADQLTVSVEPRRLVVSGEKEISVLYGDESDAHWEVRSQQIFRVHNLPADVDPCKVTATLGDHTVEIVLPKASATNERSERARSAPSTGQIRRRAYDIYDVRGREGGREVDEWIIAEEELIEQSNTAGQKTKATKAG